jgi:hypothetical protein
VWRVSISIEKIIRREKREERREKMMMVMVIQWMHVDDDTKLRE